MQIEHANHRNVGADDAADDFEQVAVGVVGAFRQRRAVAGDEDAVERRRGLQPGLDLGQEAAEEGAFDRPARLGERDPQRIGRPGAATIHLGKEAGQLRQGDRCRRPCLGNDAVAADIDIVLEILRRGEWREAIAFDGEAQNADTRIVLGHVFSFSHGEQETRSPAH